MKLIRFASFRLTLALAMITAFTATLLPLAAMAAAKKPLDSTYGYVAHVFDKLQGHWETQALDNTIPGDNVLTFTLNENGSLLSSHVDGVQSTQAVQDFLKQNAPFGPFPSGLKGSQLSFKIKLTSGSIQMLSYQVLDRSQSEPTIAYAASAVAQPASMFYTRVLPVTPGKVWDKQDARSTDESAMTSYVEQVQQQIRQNWRLAQDYTFKRTVAQLMIDRDGTLLGAQLTQSSGDKTVDRAALNAITTAGRFPTVPASAPSLPVTIEYVFEPVQQEAE
jgi:TonB family protein